MHEWRCRALGLLVAGWGLAAISLAPAHAKPASPPVWTLVGCDQGDSCCVPSEAETADGIVELKLPAGASVRAKELRNGLTASEAGNSRFQVRVSGTLTPARLVDLAVWTPPNGASGLKLHVCDPPGTSPPPSSTDKGLVDVVPLPTRTEAQLEATASAGKGTSAPAADSVTTIVNELLTNLTRIAVDRARQRALRSVLELAEQAACTLKLTAVVESYDPQSTPGAAPDARRRPAVDEAHQRGSATPPAVSQTSERGPAELVTAGTSAPGSDSPIDQAATTGDLLVETCALIRHVRGADLVAMRASLVRALMADVSRLVWGKALNGVDAAVRDAIDLVGRGALDLLLRAVTGQDLVMPVDEAHMLVSRFAAIDWSGLAPNNQAKCVLEASRKALVECAHKKSSCNLSELAKEAVALKVCQVAEGPSWAKRIPVAELARHASEAMDPQAAHVERAHAVRAFLVALLRVVSPSDSKADIDTLDRFLAAIIQQDGARLVAIFGEQLRDRLPPDDHANFARVVRFSSGVVAYAQTYRAPTRTSEDQAEYLEADRQAREAILKSLVDDLTDRSNRHSDWIISLGTSLGTAAVGGTYDRGAESGSAYFAQLSLPTGIAVQRSPSREYNVGFHCQLMLLDLGQYVAFDSAGEVTPPDYHTAVAVGTQIGMLFGSPSASFVLASEIRYAPGLFKEGALRGGLHMGFYVPFVDFN